MLAAQPARGAVAGAPEGDQVVVQAQDAVVGDRLLPVERDGVVEPPVLEQLLALEQHRDPGRGEDQRGPEHRPLAGQPAVRVARRDGLGHADLPVGDVVVGLRVDHPAGTARRGRRR